MAIVTKTPGVYVEEIPKLPPSVAQVETAIPAFVGYTEKAEERGASLLMIPTRISSLLEFRELYGGDHKIDQVTVQVNENNNFAVSEVNIANTERYLMYDSLRLYFDNGGGDCYIVSVGLYPAAPEYGDENAATPSGLRAGVKALEKYDEPTIILFPDATNVITDGTDDAGFYSLQQMAMEQCAKLQDRVGLFDLKENISADLDDAIDNFRNNIGINNLKYAAAYTPYVVATYPRKVDIAHFQGGITNSGAAAITLRDLSSDGNHLALLDNYDAIETEVSAVNAYITAIKSALESDGGTQGNFTGAGPEASSLKEKFLAYKRIIDGATTPAEATSRLIGLLNFCRNTINGFQDLYKDFETTSQIKNDINTYAKANSMFRGGACGIIKIDKNADVRGLTGLANVAAVHALYFDTDSPPVALSLDWLGAANMGAITMSDKNYGDATTDDSEHITMSRQVANDLLGEFEKLIAFSNAVVNAADGYKNAIQDQLYSEHPILNSIKDHIERSINTLPPSGAIAGVYAKVDSSRGVWKAPANVSLNSVTKPSVVISHDEQANMNVDAVAGKSINAIRTFIGKGTLVWGARTLAGNDNEWRYISVRRFFNMVEESCKKATEPTVFEPNDANTWIRVQTMIENFLTLQWRQGALQGFRENNDCGRYSRR